MPVLFVTVATLLSLILTVLLIRARFFLFVGAHTVLKLHVLWLSFTLLDTNKPTKPRPEKKRKSKKRKTPVPVKTIVHIVLSILRALFFRARILKFHAPLSIASPDPAETAKLYGTVCAVASPVASLFASRSEPGAVRVSVSPCFKRETVTGHLCFVFSIRIIDIIKELL